MSDVPSSGEGRQPTARRVWFEPPPSPVGNGLMLYTGCTRLQQASWSFCGRLMLARRPTSRRAAELHDLLRVTAEAASRAGQLQLAPEPTSAPNDGRPGQRAPTLISRLERPGALVNVGSSLRTERQLSWPPRDVVAAPRDRRSVSGNWCPLPLRVRRPRSSSFLAHLCRTRRDVRVGRPVPRRRDPSGPSRSAYTGSEDQPTQASRRPEFSRDPGAENVRSARS